MASLTRLPSFRLRTLLMVVAVIALLIAEWDFVHDYGCDTAQMVAVWDTERCGIVLLLDVTVAILLLRRRRFLR